MAPMNAVSRRWVPQQSLLALLLSLVLGLLLLSHESAARKYTVFRGPVLILENDAVAAAPSKAAMHARQLVHANEWTTMSTISVEFHGVPYSNIVSYSDGIGESPEASTGELFFYLTPMDATGADLAVNPSASIAISLAQQGRSACKMDVEDPTCWRVSITGKVVPVAADKVEFAKKALFSRHPEMEYWPSGHGFVAYVMKIENIVVLDYYGGAKHVPVDEYYSVSL